MAAADPRPIEDRGRWATGQLVTHSERFVIALLRDAGCVDPAPLLGTNPILESPRCRLCNSVVQVVSVKTIRDWVKERIESLISWEGEEPPDAHDELSYMLQEVDERWPLT